MLQTYGLQFEDGRVLPVHSRGAIYSQERRAMPNETHVFFLVKRTQFWLDVISKIVRDRPDVRLVVVDIGNFDYPRQPPWRVPRESYFRPGAVFRMFEKIGAEYFDGRRFKSEPKQLDPEEIWKLRVAVESSLISAMRKSLARPGKHSGLLQKLADRLVTTQSERVFALAVDALREFSPSHVFIVNGRFAGEQACVLAARRREIEITFLEINGIFANLFARPYRIQDRVASQQHALLVGENLSKANLRDSADRWVTQQREKNSVTNPFNKLWVDSSGSWNSPRESLALFATSSRDEYESLDIDWKEASWENQLDSFQAVWDKIKSSELTPVLRVHPNLLNKQPMSGLREIFEIKRFMRKNPDFVVVWPSSRVSTYDLISYSDVVIVQNSTVGLEASIRGIPVICTDSCGYDLVADVYSIHGPSDLDKLKPPFTADKSGAEIFVAAQDALDERIERNEAGVDIHNHSRVLLLILSVLDGSLASIVFELRWKAYRFVTLRIFPK